jgi:hypothetical protein
MAANAGIQRDITNKSGRVTSITRMLAARVPLEVIANITGHRNLKTLAIYDRVVLLKVRAAQKILMEPYNRETGALNDFDKYYQREMQQYNANQLGVDVDIVRDENSHAGDLDEDDPNDFNGFDTDAVEDPGGTIELGSSSDNQENLNVFVNTTRNIPNRGGVVQAFGRGGQYSGCGCLPSRSSPCVPLPPPTGHGHGSVTHVRNKTSVTSISTNTTATNTFCKSSTCYWYSRSREEFRDFYL